MVHGLEFRDYGLEFIVLVYSLWFKNNQKTNN